MGPTKLSFWITAFLAGLSHAAPPLFDTEKITLDPKVDLANLSAPTAALFHPGTNVSRPANRTCKVYPDDADWPSEEKWSTLSTLVGGRLLKPRPQAAVCYNGPEYDGALCAQLTANWTSSYTHINDPIEMMSPVYEGLTCLPPGIYDSHNCTQGGLPLYVINATSVKDIQLGVNFARNTGVRLVVRNTGHDFSGKSGGGNSLSIWTHHFKEIDYIENYEDADLGYSGPAFKAGSGVQAFEIYKAASEKNRTVVGGEGETVGIFGGYIQGGGHSPLTSLYGTGADQVLAFEVILADGSFVSANPTSHPDLFWALRGGGGGTFGVVTSVTVKAHPDTHVTASRFSFTSANITNNTFWAGVRAYFDYFEQNADAGTYAYYLIIPNATVGVFTFQMAPFFAPGLDLNQTHALLDPWISRLNKLGIYFNPNITYFDNFYSAWRSSFPLEVVEKTNVQTGSRLFPRENFHNETLRNITFANIRLSGEQNHVQVHFNIKAVDPANADNAVNPAWRKNLLFAQQSQRWSVNSTASEILQIRHNFTFVDMQRWRDISPGAGSYPNESDRMEPNFGEAFWGYKYPKLLSIKKKYDPNEVFWAATAAGSESWHVVTKDGLPNENGKLCRVASS